MTMAAGPGAEKALPQPFMERLLPAPKDGGFQRDDMWIWDGSVIQGEDGLWHMFASMWPKTLPFSPNWVTNSRVVRAVAKRPEGPYTYAEDVLPPREGGFWDGKMTHNPTIQRVNGTYLLFYNGSTYDAPIPTGPASEAVRRQAAGNQRVGLAIASSPAGPWTRMDKPLIEPKPGTWEEGSVTTNPAAWVEPDGSILLLYKSKRFRYGAARSKHFLGPYVRLTEKPIHWDRDGQAAFYEDVYAWKENGVYQMIFCDMKGLVSGENHAGGHAFSYDGAEWTLAPQPKAYSRKVRWEDGSETVQGSLERPQLIIQDGHPTHVIFATADGPGGWKRASKTWSLVIPLKKPEGAKAEGR